MAKKLAVIAIHGMGDTDENFADPLRENVRDMLTTAQWADIHFDTIWYQDIFQANQEALFDRSKSQLDGMFLRRFLLYGISDAAGLEYSRTKPDSAYEITQLRIFETLGRAYQALGAQTGPVVVVAQSLGGQVISNYIWDARKVTPPPVTWGLWRHPHDDLSEEELDFRKFGALRTLFTTGCNIPVFVGGLPPEEIVPISRPNPHFQWFNYFDEDDVLGWPLQPLNPDGGYSTLVQDVAINAGGLFSSWNLLSHGKYWTDNDFLRPLTAHLSQLLAE